MTDKIHEYADLLVNVGLNIKKGQKVYVNASVECAAFVRMCVEAAYDAGASEVMVGWYDDFTNRQRYLKASDDVFDVYPKWDAEKLNEYARNNVAVLKIYASDPESLAGVDSDRITRFSIARGNALKEHYAAQMSNAFQWCIGSVPTPSWAKKVFPLLSEEDAMNALMDAILKSVRVSGKGDSAELWREHIARTAALCDKLNSYNFKYLQYKNSIGTDFICELPEGHLWMGGAEKTKDGVPFVANMPTEEIFTAPKKDGINGIIMSSKPLCIDGNIIEGIKFTVKDGKIINAEAKQGEDILKKAISVDEGASYFGEIALVPFDSPISNMNIMFYNTLYDENASCHMAFGEAYPCIEGGNDMSREELSEKGFNYSITHEDFMIGTADLSIIGITHDNKQISIFKDGNFAI